MKVLTIFVRHGLDKYANAQRDLTAVVERQLPGLTRDVIVVDTALPAETVEQLDGSVLLGSDNRHREFGAFDRAVAWAGGTLHDYDLVQFVTSAFNTLYTSYLERFDHAALGAIIGRPVCLGHIDCYNDPVRFESYVSQHWIRTCFFFLPPEQVTLLGSFVSVPSGAAYFSGTPGEPFRSHAPIDERYRSYITGWLTGDDIGQGVTWHSKEALTPEGLHAFEQKTLCILNEHKLAVRLRAMGCALIDVTWLSTLVKTLPPAQIPWHLSWRSQLANRDRDQVRPGS